MLLVPPLVGVSQVTHQALVRPMVPVSRVLQVVQRAMGALVAPMVRVL